MQYRLISYQLPNRLNINGLQCKCKPTARRGPLDHKKFQKKVWEYFYSCYRTIPKAKELNGNSSWLLKRKPFLVDVEKSLFRKLTKKGQNLNDKKIEVLPEKILFEDYELTRKFDRYYLRERPTKKEISFVFDYMAPTYEEDIDYGMNLNANRQILEIIANFELPIYPDDESVKILDFGVGTGISANAKPDIKKDNLPPLEIEGFDISKQMIEKAREKIRSNEKRTSLLVGAYQIKEGKDGIVPLFPDNYFHAAMACFAVDYFIGPRPYQEIYRLLKENAPFVCSVLGREAYEIIGHAKNVGFYPLQNFFKVLKRKVKSQTVILLTFIKKKKG